MATETCRFGVRAFVHPNGHPTPRRYEVFDRATGTAVVSGLAREEAERDARRRNHDRSGATGIAVRLNPFQVAQLRNAIEAYLYMGSTVGGPEQHILEALYGLFRSLERGMKAISPGQRRILRRLTLAGVLFVVVGLTQGIDAAMATAFSLAVMEIDARSS